MILYSEEQIKEKISNLGERMRCRYKKSAPIFLGVLNGSFIFLADLVREFDEDCEIDFCRIKSYVNNQRGETYMMNRWRLIYSAIKLLLFHLVKSYSLPS